MEAMAAAALEGAGVADLESLLLPLLIPEETWEMSGSCDMVVVDLCVGWMQTRARVYRFVLVRDVGGAMCRM